MQLKMRCLLVSGFMLLGVGASFAQIISPLRKEGPGYYAGDADGVYELAPYKVWRATHAAEISSIFAKVLVERAGGQQTKCIGHSLTDCVAAFASTMAVADDYKSDILFGGPERDVNGRITGRHLPEFWASLWDDKAQMQNRFIVRLNIDGQQRVKGLEVLFQNVPGPLAGQTEAEYERSGIFEIFSALDKEGCAKLGRIGLYQFIENRVKPLLRKAPNDGHGNQATEHRIAGPVSVCGTPVSFHIHFNDHERYNSQFYKYFSATLTAGEMGRYAR